MNRHERAIALRTGRRSLAARRLLDADGAAAGPLAVTTAIRAKPAMVAIADRTHHGIVSHRYLYGAGDDIVLEEHVEGGTHEFVLCLHQAAAARLTAYVDPMGRSPAEDEDPIIRRGRAVEQGWNDVATAAGQVEAVTQLFSARPGPRELATVRLSVVEGTRSVAVVAGYYPSDDRPRAVEPVVSTRELSRRSLTEMFTAFLDQTPVVGEPSVGH